MLHIALYQPEKPSNVGNIMRTCAALGATLHVIGPVSFTPSNKELTRAAMDYGLLLTFKTYDGYGDFISNEKPARMLFVTRYGKKIFSDADLGTGKDDLYLVFGSESSGIPLDILKEQRHNTLRIPMKPAARSLNLANTVAILAYETFRQWGYPDLALQEVLKGPYYL